MTISMWNTRPGWNGLNKSESFITVIIKVNPIQNGFFQGSQKPRYGRGDTKQLMLVLEKWHLEGGFENVWKIVKLGTSSIKFHWRQQLLSEISKVADI